MGTKLTGTKLRTRGRMLIGPLLTIGVCLLLLTGLQLLSRDLDYRRIVSDLRHLPDLSLAKALAATAGSYLALVGRDWLALRRIGVRVPAPAIWLGSVTGSALGNAAGFGVLTGGAVRYRVFGAAGIRADQVGRMTLLTGATFGIGLLVLGSLGAVVQAAAIGELLHLPPLPVLAGGLAALAATAAAILWCALRRQGLRVGHFALEWPGTGFVLAQILLVGLDVAGAAACLWALMPDAAFGFATFLPLYTAALLLGVVAHTPAGLGVFEAAMLFSLGHNVPPSAAVAALLAYRAVYFLLPLLLSAVLLGGFELLSASRRLRRGLAPGAIGRGVHRLAPVFLGVVTFCIGIMLVISGATPAFTRRLVILQGVIPLWVLEGSQFLGSVLGVWLLFVARGLFQRLDAAWWLALGVAAASLVLSLAKGLAFIEAGVLAGLILLLLATRHRFTRPASLFREPFTPAWLTSVGVVLIVAFWVLFFAFRHVPYCQEMWWQFAFDEKAPRALRATFGATVFASAVALWQMLRLASGTVAGPTEDDLRQAERIVRGQDRSDAMLAMMGDKTFLFSPSRTAFLMYAKRGRSWVALHDPVGPRGEWPELIRAFVALARAHGGRAAFYQIRAESLPLYLDAGLSLLKLGEEARIGLQDFRLEGARRANLRYALKRGERDGLAAEVIAPEAIGSVLGALDEISAAWLRTRREREKGFSVASFDPGCPRAQSVILIRQNGRPVAFAAFMTTDLHAEATVGAMRHVAGASPYAMEFLFTRLAMHLKEAGFSSLSLGMAPLSGLAAAPVRRSWHRVARLLWRYGGRIYNFQGLRAFKSKFNPSWEPRYLAASGGIGSFMALADIAVLAAGGDA